MVDSILNLVILQHFRIDHIMMLYMLAEPYYVLARSVIAARRYLVLPVILLCLILGGILIFKIRILNLYH